MTHRLIVLSLAALLAGLACGDAAAQKLYRWVDKDGNVHYSDKVPPSEVDQARDELNRQGRTVDRVDRALTPEEQAAAAAAAEIAAAEQKAREEQERMDAILLGSYQTEPDLERAYRERFDLVEQSIESARIGIRSQEKSLAEILAHAADLERSGKPVGANIQTQIEISRKQVSQQADYLAKREAEKAALQKEYERTLARYRELVAERDARKRAAASN